MDVVLNKARYALVGAIEEASEADVRAEFETNFFGALRMIRQQGCEIIGVSRVAGIIAGPITGFYNSSKNFQHAIGNRRGVLVLAYLERELRSVISAIPQWIEFSRQTTIKSKLIFSEIGLALEMSARLNYIGWRPRVGTDAEPTGLLKHFHSRANSRRHSLQLLAFGRGGSDRVSPARGSRRAVSFDVLLEGYPRIAQVGRLEVWTRVGGDEDRKFKTVLRWRSVFRPEPKHAREQQMGHEPRTRITKAVDAATLKPAVAALAVGP